MKWMCMATSARPLRPHRPLRAGPRQEPSERGARRRWCTHPEVEATSWHKTPSLWLGLQSHTDCAQRRRQGAAFSAGGGHSPAAEPRGVSAAPVSPGTDRRAAWASGRVWRPPAAFSSTIWAPTALNVILPTSARQHLTSKLQAPVPPAREDTRGARGAGMVHSLSGSRGHRVGTYFSFLIPTAALL